MCSMAAIFCAMPPRGAGCDGEPHIYTSNVFWVSKTTAMSSVRQVQPAVLFQRMLGVKSDGNDSSPGSMPAPIPRLFPAAQALGDPCSGRVRTCMEMVSERLVSEKNNDIVNTGWHGFWMAIIKTWNNGLNSERVRRFVLSSFLRQRLLQMSIKWIIQTRFVHHSEFNWKCPNNSNQVWIETANKQQICYLHLN